MSLAVNYSQSAEFAQAGYEDIQVNPSLVVGQVRQSGNLSFSRIYDAGHLTPAYQPEGMLTVFERIIFGKSIAKGDEYDSTTYSTTGPSNSTKTFEAPPQEEPTCFIFSLVTCDPEEITYISLKQGTITNGVWTLSNETYTLGNDILGSEDVKGADGQNGTSAIPGTGQQPGSGQFEGFEEGIATIMAPSLPLLLLVGLILAIAL